MSRTAKVQPAKRTTKTAKTPGDTIAAQVGQVSVQKDYR